MLILPCGPKYASGLNLSHKENSSNVSAAPTPYRIDESLYSCGPNCGILINPAIIRRKIPNTK
jgi:hypothetical protein